MRSLLSDPASSASRTNLGNISRSQVDFYCRWDKNGASHIRLLLDFPIMSEFEFEFGKQAENDLVCIEENFSERMCRESQIQGSYETDLHLESEISAKMFSFGWNIELVTVGIVKYPTKECV